MNTNNPLRRTKTSDEDQPQHLFTILLEGNEYSDQHQQERDRRQQDDYYYHATFLSVNSTTMMSVPSLFELLLVPGGGTAASSTPGDVHGRPPMYPYYSFSSPSSTSGTSVLQGGTDNISLDQGSSRSLSIPRHETNYSILTNVLAILNDEIDNDEIATLHDEERQEAINSIAFCRGDEATPVFSALTSSSYGKRAS